MDATERLRLMKLYAAMADSQLIELLREDRDNFNEGVFEIIADEAYKRKLSVPQQKQEPHKVSIDESAIEEIICPTCGCPNAIENSACENCGAFFNRSGFDPLSIARTQGEIYGKLTKTDRKSNSLRIIGRVIVALVFLVSGIGHLLFGITTMKDALDGEGGIAAFVFSCILSIFCIVLGAMMLKPIISRKE